MLLSKIMCESTNKFKKDKIFFETCAIMDVTMQRGKADVVI